jgi:hypothetical protein
MGKLHLKDSLAFLKNTRIMVLVFASALAGDFNSPFRGNFELKGRRNKWPDRAIFVERNLCMEMRSVTPITLAKEGGIPTCKE